MDQRCETMINRVLAILKQRCAEIRSVMPLNEVTARAIRNHPSSPLLEEAVTAIYGLNESLEEILEQAASSDMMIGGTASAAFYEKEYRPNKERFVHAYLDLLFGFADEAQGTENAKRYRPIEPETTAYETLATALGDHETTLQMNLDFHETDSQFDFEACHRLMALGFFQPDHWLARQRAIGPLVLERKSRSVPGHVRVRFKEIHRSFVVGNFLSTVALARSTLEYALIDRGRPLGYEPFESQMGNRRSKRLIDLVDAASVARPPLREAMDLVRETGNQVIHPRKHSDVTRFPHLQEAEAFDCIRALREVLVDLYSD